VLTGQIFKVFSVQTVIETVSFLQDQKLGHYMKVPPRATFIAQLSACSVTCLVQSGVKEWMFKTIADICLTHQKDLLTCNNAKVFFTSSIIWGLIGPERLFSKGSLYHPEVYAALVGALIPVPLWLWVRKYPRSIFRNVNMPVLLNGGLYIPPATGVNYSSWLVVGFTFQYWMRRHRFAWWSKVSSEWITWQSLTDEEQYNYVLSVAMDVGTALSVLFIFLVIDLPGVSINWWGNHVYQNSKIVSSIKAQLALT